MVKSSAVRFTDYMRNVIPIPPMNRWAIVIRRLRRLLRQSPRDHVISLIASANVASIKVAKRLGETVEGETELMGHHVLIYGISRDEWRKKREANSQD